MGKDLDIIQAVKDNDAATLQKLLQKASKAGKNKIIGHNKKQLNINHQDSDGMCALHQAALMSNTPMLKTLLEAGASPALRDNKGMIALHYAVWQGVPQSVQLLLQRGSPVNEQALEGETPLHLACQHGHLEVATLLLNQHADPTICNKNLLTPLDLACEFGRTRVVELLLRSNLCQKLLEDSPTDTLDNSRTTCMHLAARGGHGEVIKLLLKAGMNINRSTLKGTCLHEAALAGKTDVVRLLLDCGVDVNKPNSYDQTALDIVQKFTSGHAGKELKKILKEASCAVYARAVKSYSNVYDSGSLSFKEGEIITVLEQKSDGIWRGYVVQDGRIAQTGMFPANHVVLIDNKVAREQQQQQQQQQHQQHKQGQMYGQVPDLLNRGPMFAPAPGMSHYQQGMYYNNGVGGGGDRGSVGSSGTDDSGSQPGTPHSFPSTPSSGLPPPPASLLTSGPPRSPFSRASGGADSGFSSSQSLPQYTPSSPAGPQQFAGKSPFPYGPTVTSSAPNGSIPHLTSNGGTVEHGDWPAPPSAKPLVGGMDMRGASPARDSPVHSNRNSAASSDSGRGFSTGHVEAKTHNYVNVHVANHHQQQHRLSGQSYESGVSSRQSYHSTSSSSLGSLDRLEEPGYAPTINVSQLFQAGVPDQEVLRAWLSELHYEEYLPLFLQAGYDMPTISRMTPEDLTAIGITKPAHRKRLKSEIARLNIHDGIPDYKPNDLMEWLHLLGLGSYLDTLCNQGYDDINYVTDITWEDLEEIGIQKLGHQKKIMLAIDRLKRITSGAKRLSSVDGRTASLELLEPPPPAPPMTARWSGDITAIPPHVYDGALGGARPKKSPSGDSISTTSSGHSGSSTGSGVPINPGMSGEVRVIPLPREDAGLAGAMPYRHNSTGSASGMHQPDVVAIQVKRNMRSSTSEDKRDGTGQPLMYQSFQGPTTSRRLSEGEVFQDSPISKSLESEGYKQYPMTSLASAVGGRQPRLSSKSESEKHESEINSDGTKPSIYSAPALQQKQGSTSSASASLRVETGEHIYDMPQLSPSQKSPSRSPGVNTRPYPQTGAPGEPLHVHTSGDPALSDQPKQSPTGGRAGGKKIPPPPPKRTHSIRTESGSEGSAPGSPSRSMVAPSTITVSASVHPQPSTVISAHKQPPPVMQKPQKPQSPIVVNKVQHPIQQHPPQPSQQQVHHQLNHPPPPSQQLQQQQQRQQQQPQHQLQQHNPVSGQHPPPPHVTQQIASHPVQNLPGPPVAQKPQSPKPLQAQKGQIQVGRPGNPAGPQPQVLVKPKPPYVQQQQQQQQPKSPLPVKAAVVSNVPPKTSQPLPVQQKVLSQPAGPQPSKVQPPTSQVSNTAPTQEPQVQAFASCVKSLSEKFGKHSGTDGEEEDQFPDNVSTDSDDFPPPPPPIAMDIITPKIHNYGIPSTRTPGKPQFGFNRHHQPEYSPSKGRGSPLAMRNLSAPLGGITGPPPVGPGHEHVSRTPPRGVSAGQSLITPAGPVPQTGRPGMPHPVAAGPGAKPHYGQSAGSDHERTPEPETGGTMSSDKRSESTTSFESNSSSSSVDSNTLPFANENVGTIKQRAANVKPSIVQSSDMENGHRNVDLNSHVFANSGESQRTMSGHSNSLSSSNPSSSFSSHHPQGYPSNPQHASWHASSNSPQWAQTNTQSGAIRPPVPSKKPTLSPKPSRPNPEVTRSAFNAPHPASSSNPGYGASPPTQTAQPAPNSQKAPETGNVLCDIDNMLQDLTDELDAMLEEEQAS